MMKSDVTIVDNVLNDHDLDYILNRVESCHFPWYWSSVVENDVFISDLKYNYQLGHTLFNEGKIASNDFNILLPLLDLLNIKTIHRIKINSNPMTSTIIEHGYHVDNEIPNSKTSIFYLNTNDGYTKFKETNQTVSSVRNRLITFDTHLLHTGTTCTNQSRRMVINLNYDCKDN